MIEKGWRLQIKPALFYWFGLRFFGCLLQAASSFYRFEAGKTEDLTAAARAFIQKGEAVKGKFEEFEMSPDFLERLQESLNAYEKALAPKAAGEGKKGRGAAGSGSDLIETGGRLVDVLDVVMNNKYRDESERLEEWRLASSLEKGARKNQKKTAKN